MAQEAKEPYELEISVHRLEGVTGLARPCVRCSFWRFPPQVLHPAAGGSMVLSGGTWCPSQVENAVLCYYRVKTLRSVRVILFCARNCRGNERNG